MLNENKSYKVVIIHQKSITLNHKEKRVEMLLKNRGLSTKDFGNSLFVLSTFPISRIFHMRYRVIL